MIKYNNYSLAIGLMNLTLSLVTSSAYAADSPDTNPFPGTFSGSITGVTDYRFRGISQTQDDPAVQAGAEWSHPSGLKLGVWGSNVDFGSAAGSGSLETDIYGSYTWQLSDALTLETALYAYLYPGSSSHLDYDYGEGAVIASYTCDILTLTGSFNYTPDNFGDSGNAYYPQLGVAVALPHDITIDGAIGRQWVDDNAAFALPDYNTWNLGIAYTWQGFTGKVQYIDTNISNGDCAVGCDATGLVSITRKF